MRKSTVIAQCLVNSNMIRKLQDAEWRVQQVFEDEFPHYEFVLWNHEIDKKYAEDWIKNVGRASMINVKLFIEDFGDMKSFRRRA